MKFTLVKASDWDYEKTIIVNSLEDLKKIYPCLVVDFERMTITIYDTWLY